MNILQIVPEMKYGGVERGTLDLAKYLKRQGHKAIVVSAGGPLADELKKHDITHYTLPVHKKSPFSLFLSIRGLVRIVRNESIDLIHARSRVPALAAFFVSRQTEVPFITTCHGFYSRHALSRPMGWGKFVIAASHIIARRMRDDFGVSHEKIRLVHRGVDLDEFTYGDRIHKDASGPVVVGMIGRLTPIKGHELFLKAMARVVRVYPNVRIQIIGDSTKSQYKEELMLLVRNLDLSGFVEFLGNRYDIAERLKQINILVTPSVGEEAFGRVVIEAGASGVPVVATRIGGLVDIIEDEKTGLLVGPQDPRVLAEAISRLIKDPELAASLAKNLRARVEQEFTLEKMFKKTLEVYEEALGRKRILVIKLGAVGDTILIIPSLRAIRQRYPNAWIAVLTGSKARAIVRNCPYVDDTIVYESKGASHIFSLLDISKILLKEDYDLVIDLQNNRASHFISYFCGARTRAGFANRKWSFFLNKRAKASQADLGPIDHQMEVLKLVDIQAAEKKLELWTTSEEEERINDFLESQWVSPSQILVGINPCASVRWPTKQWSLENFAKLCDDLAKKNIRVVITGSSENASMAAELLALTKNKPLNAVGKTSVTELAALIRRCRVFVSPDSAPMHIAAALGVPLVALFGPTDPKRHLVPPRHYKVFWTEVDCSPCYLRTCSLGHGCMKNIAERDVYDTILSFIEVGDRAANEPALEVAR